MFHSTRQFLVRSTIIPTQLVVLTKTKYSDNAQAVKVIFAGDLNHTWITVKDLDDLYTVIDTITPKKQRPMC